MRLRRYLTWTLVGATILSLLLHFFTIFGETLYGFMEAQLEPEAAIRKTTRKLADQSLDEEDLAAEEKKPKAKPLIDKVTVYLVPASRLQPKPVVAPKPPAAKKAKPAPKLKPKPKPKAESMVEAAAEPADTPVAGPLAEAEKPAPPPEPPKPEVPAPEVDKPKPAETPAADAPARRKGTYQPGEARKGFPRHVRMKMLAMGIGEVSLEWKRDKNSYRIEVDGSALGQRRRMISEGVITPAGLRPNTYKVYVGSSEHADHQCLFNWEASTVQVGKVEEMKTEPLDEDAQDLFSFPFQFAAYGSKMKDFDIQICTGRKIQHQTLTIQGETTLFIGGRDIPVLVVKGENERGKAEAWLAPDYNNIPVKFYGDSATRKISGSLIATDLEIDGKVILAPQKPVNQELYPGAS